MSHEAQTWALKITTGSPTRKAVLMYLANRANTEDGASWPSQGRVAKETEFGERTVRDALKDLEEMGIIRRITRQGTSDMIYLNMNWRPAGAAGVQDTELPKGPAGDAAAADSAAGNAGDDRQELPEGAAGDAGEPRQELPPNLQEEPSSNHQNEPSVKRRHVRAHVAEFPDDAFDRFWAKYPNKTAKPVARKSWEKIEFEGKVEFSDIMVGLDFYLNKDDFREWCMPSTWLNQERWNDRPKQKSRTSQSRRQTMAI
jgi:hypothetical protein